MTDGIAFETMPIKKVKTNKKVSTHFTKKMCKEAIEPYHTSTVVRYLIQRHKMGLLQICVILFILENGLIVYTKFIK